MLSSRNIVLHFVFVWCVGATHGPGRASRDIAPTDTTLHVINEIISSLRIKLKGNSHKKELPIHNYFDGFSRYKSDNWKEILRLTSFDIKIDNSSTDYTTTVINEVLNGENKTEGAIDKRKDDGEYKQRKNFLRKLKEVYLRNIPYRNLSNKTSQLISKGHTSHSTCNKNTVDGEFNHAENGTNDIKVRAPSSARRIFRGQETRIYYYPFVASVHIFNKFTCAGSIIAADLVITAASCLQLAHNNRFYHENPSFLTVRVGSSFYSGAGDLIPVLEVYFHPMYDPPTLHNNLAIMRLQRYILFRNRSRVKKVDIDTRANALPMNADGVVIVGWGAKTVSNKVKSPLLNKIAVSILDFYPLEECQEIYSKTYVTDRHFCAGFIARGGGACNRDVGAPGLSGGLLAGVVSFGSSSCGAADAPTVFTKLGFYTDWIEEIMSQEPNINRPKATQRPPPIHTIKTTTPTPLEFAIEPLLRSRQGLPLTPLDARTGHDQDSKEFLRTTYLRYPLVSYVSNEEPASYEQQDTNKEQMEDENIQLAELTKTRNTQEHADSDLAPTQYILSATTIHNFVLRDKISQFTVLNKLPQPKKVKTKSIVAELLPKRINSIEGEGLPRYAEFTEATTETKLDPAQFVQLDTKDFDMVDNLLNEVDTESTKKFTETDKLPKIDKVKITTKKVVPKQQSMDVRHVDMTRVKKYTESELTFNTKQFVSLDMKENSFIAEKKSLSEADTEFAMNNSVAEKSPEPAHDKMYAYEATATRLPQIASPKKQRSDGKSLQDAPFEKEQEAEVPTVDGGDLVIEPPEVTFSDPELNQQINELIDYMNIIDIISTEEEYNTHVENIIGTKKLPLEILEIDDEKLEQTDRNMLKLENMNEIDQNNRYITKE